LAQSDRTETVWDVALVGTARPIAFPVEMGSVRAYGLLEGMTGNPVITLNRAVATAMVNGPVAGLAVLDGVADRLLDSYRLDAVRAHLLDVAGDRDAAIASYRRAAGRTTNLPEQRYLATQAARLRSHPDADRS
jgi:predicted RNA polymerase sigma factor